MPTVEEDAEEIRRITRQLAAEIKNKECTVLSLLELVFDKIKSLVVIMRENLEVIYANKATLKFLGKESARGVKCHELFYDSPIPCPNCQVNEVIKTRRIGIVKKTKALSGYVATCIPLIANGVTGVIELIEEEKKNIA